MIIHDLVKRYEDTGGGLLGWQERPVDFAINLSSNGEVIDISAFTSSDGKKKRRSFMLPEEPQGRTSGIKPAFLCDKKGYFFGAVDDEKKQARALRMHAESSALHRAVLDDAKSPAALAVKEFFSIQKSQVELEELGNYIFMFQGNFMHEDAVIVDAWNAYIASKTSDDKTCCLVSGEVGTVTKLHGKIHLPGVSMGAVPLVSINAESFTSYGSTSSDPAAQIIESTSFAYVTALNDLLKDNRHRQRIGTDTIVFWADGNGEHEAEVFSWALQPEEDGNELLDGLMKAYAQGLPVDVGGVDSAKGFHILALSPNAGRISVRFYITDSFDAIMNNLMEHYENLKIIAPKNDKYPFIPPWVLISETTVTKKSSDTVPLLSGQLLSSILTGQRYPLTLYNSILGRAKSNESINKTKAAIIKAVLMRNFQESEVATVALNDESNNAPYVLGRLFATLEYLQRQASGGTLNATIKDKYFGSACSNPGSVFPILLKLSMHHSAKLDKPGFYEKLKADLLGKLNDEKAFPAAMNLEDQGKFILGYYHQTQYFYTPKNEKETTTNKEDQ